MFSESPSLRWIGTEPAATLHPSPCADAHVTQQLLRAVCTSHPPLRFSRPEPNETPNTRISGVQGLWGRSRGDGVWEWGSSTRLRPGRLCYKHLARWSGPSRDKKQMWARVKRRARAAGGQFMSGGAVVRAHALGPPRMLTIDDFVYMGLISSLSFRAFIHCPPDPTFKIETR